MLLHVVGIALILSACMLVDSTMIRSDRVTNFGTWGSLDQCPAGSFIKAINVKVEARQGWGDDTAMNAVNLNCVPIDSQVTSASMDVSKVLKSSEGPWGTFRGLDFCYEGVAIGFILRSEGRQGRGDDTAADDMKLICAEKNGQEETSEKGATFGSWGSAKTCPPQMAICGLQTQVESPQGKGDDTALNNVDLLCCDLPNPAATCNPHDDWQAIVLRDNTEGTTPMKYTVSEKVGVQKELDLSQASSVSEELSLTVGFGVSDTLFGTLGYNFETKLGVSTTTQHSWSQTESSVFSEEKVETMDVEIPAKCKMTLFKIVGRCGPYVVNSNAIKREDNCTDGKLTTTHGRISKHLFTRLDT